MYAFHIQNHEKSKYEISINVYLLGLLIQVYENFHESGKNMYVGKYDHDFNEEITCRYHIFITQTSHDSQLIQR